MQILKLKNALILPAKSIGQICWDISDNELVQTCEKTESTVCKEGNNSDYQPDCEDISDVEDLI